MTRKTIAAVAFCLLSAPALAQQSQQPPPLPPLSQAEQTERLLLSRDFQQLQSDMATMFEAQVRARAAADASTAAPKAKTEHGAPPLATQKHP